MTKIVLLILIILVGCTNYHKIAVAAGDKCPQIGVDIVRPDFSQKHTMQEIDGFYKCIIKELPSPKLSLFQKFAGMYIEGRIMNDSIYKKQEIREKVKYQHILWHQVLLNEKTIASAQEAYMIFTQNMNKLIATQNNAAAVNSAADASNMHY